MFILLDGENVIDTAKDTGHVELTAEQVQQINTSKYGHAQFKYISGNLVTNEAFMNERAREKMVVSRAAAKIALHQAGLLAQIESIMADPGTDEAVKIAWSDALEFKRNSPTLLALAQTLSLTDEQLDGLFAAASQIRI